MANSSDIIFEAVDLGHGMLQRSETVGHPHTRNISCGLCT